MPTSPVKTRIPITSFGHLITEVKGYMERQRGAFRSANVSPRLSPTHGRCELRRRGKDTRREEWRQQKQLFGIEAPAPGDLTGWRKYFNSYTLQGRRNYVLATYGICAVAAAAYWMHKQHGNEKRASGSTA